MDNTPQPPIGESRTAGSRPPYGRLKQEGDHALPARPYEGQTYYDQPALKRSHWGHLVSAYFFVGGVAGGAQILSQIADVLGDEDDRAVVRNGRYLALVGSAVSPVLLIADLHRPWRFLNMLRIVRTTSAMSLGAWTLTVFGTLSGATAAAQVLEDRTGHGGFRVLGRVTGIPAALSAAVLATYTGTLLAATSTPLWAAGGRLMPVLFGSSAMSTATAALVLAEHRRHRSASLPKLEQVALAAGAVEAVAAKALDARWRQEQLAGPLDEEPTRTAYRVGFHALGLLAPLAVHGLMALTGRRPRAASTLAATATLAGGYLLRHVMISAGNRSAQRPRDYFRTARLPGDRAVRGIEGGQHSAVSVQQNPGTTSSRPPVAPAAPAPPQQRHSLAADVLSLGQIHQAVLDGLERVLTLPPRELRDELAQSGRLLVRMRDRLIEYLRRDTSSPATPRRREALATINAVLSLISGVEFPAAGVRRDSVAQARDTLRTLRIDDLAIE